MTTTTDGPPDPARLRSGWSAKWRAVDPDVIPSWVADMDLGVPPRVLARVSDVLGLQDLGYPYWPDGDPVATAFAERMRERYSWDPTPGRVRVLSDLIQVLQIVIEHTTRPGDGVAIHVPAYPPFLAAIQRAQRVIVPVPMLDGPDGWHADLGELDAQLARRRCPLMVLVNPHNPTGRVFDRAELQALADRAIAHDAVVLADEIHADLTYPQHTHTPFASLGAATAARTITTTSATKTFNIAGMRCAVAHVGHDPTAEALDAAPLDYFGTPSVLSRVATVAAWRESGDWHQRLLTLLRHNRERVAAWAAAAPVPLRHHRPQATYLGWVDFADTPIADDPARHVLEHGRVRLSPGADFSQHTALGTARYARINFATTPATLEAILAGVDRALRVRS